MKFSEVVKNPVEGKKIRRANWGVDYFWVFEYREYFKDLILINPKGNPAKICASDLTTDNWSVFKDFVLSDKIEWKGDEAVSIEHIQRCVRNTKLDIKNFLFNFSCDNGLDPKSAGKQLGKINHLINKNFGGKLL